MATVHVVGAAIFRDGQCLVAQRGPSMSLVGKWEFPGGKVEPGELPAAALVREIAEELGLQIAVAELLGSGSASVGQHLIALDVYAATIVGGTLALREHAQIAWAGAEELLGFDWAAADVPCLAGVQGWLRARRSSSSPARSRSVAR